MIKLYRKENSQQADTIEAEFHDMILGYDRVVVAEQEAQQMFGREISLPVITNNEKVVSGEAIPDYLQELRQLISNWQKFQVAACYVDDDERIC